MNVDAALERILHDIPLPHTEMHSLWGAQGRVLAQDIIAPADFPPFPYSAVDGYALRAEDSVHAQAQYPIELRVVADILAGHLYSGYLQAGQAARIMTGAPIPEGANAVIMLEDTDATWSNQPDSPMPTSVKLYKSLAPLENIRPKGENVQQGQSILKAGHVLRPADIGMIATLGIAQISVTRQPRIAIISTGDELLEPSEPLSAGKIYDANRYALAASIALTGAIPVPMPIARDSLDDVRAVFQQALAQSVDMIVCSAGVSMGAADVVRLVLQELGEVNLWKINLRPGKPLTFGRVHSPTGTAVPVFGLPGNPVSALVTYEVLVRPALLKCLGRPDNARYVMALTGERFTSDGRRTYVRVQLHQRGEHLIATHSGNQSSGALMSFVMADGLMIIPEDTKALEEGTPVRVKYLADH